ncbi:pathway-specific nitrogen regulator [Kwoniella heveanensis BCC8398]|uniref:Pathway-specific nitrogen regulator n=1 Tax=Kwoniella heveanensis BCC8398 TaxID=1296120 RepID=A0A1B9GRI6_9TREE|nr:pathway-specific nitrogen regulator [Kwoniella heveanensis BCC8398]
MSSNNNSHDSHNNNNALSTSIGAGVGDGHSSDLAGPSSPGVQLACFYCRSKRIRCNGVRPRCEGCTKAGVSCEWPAARAKKRTKKQMEEARRLEAKNGEGLIGNDNDEASSSTDFYGNQNTFLGDPSEFWNLSSSSSNYIWPTDFSVPPLPSQSGIPSNMPDLTQGQGQEAQMPNISSISAFSSTSAAVPGPPSVASSGPMPPPLLSSMSGISATAGGSGSQDTGFMLPTSWSPSADLRLVNALEGQMAFINGNPEEDKDLELYYYRLSGSTAIHPGINRIGLRLQRRTDASPLAAPQAGEEESPSSVVAPSADLFDHTGMPHPHIWRPLFALFFKHMSQHFPSTSHQRMMERFETGTMSQFLACCICSLGARFSPGCKDPNQAAAPFIAKAQQLVIPLLHLPTHDVATGLLYLAWGNYGQSSESGLWQYSGMAIRMAIDLGIHEVSELYESQAHVVRTRLLFWSLFITDRVVAFATGRPASIPEDIVEIPLPSDEDFFPDPARNLPEYPHEEIEPVPFVQLVKLMIIVGRISNVLNGRRGRARTLVSTSEPLPELLAELQVRLVQFYSTLPEPLRWSADNFKHQHDRGHGGTYLALHLWANAVLALIYHPELLKSPSGIETPLNKSMNRNVQLSLASSRQICECMVFADLVDATSYTSAPYLTQPLFVAAMAFIHEMRSLTIASEGNGNGEGGNPNPTDILMLSMAKQNFQALLNASQKMEEYWAGANYVVNILEKRSGFPRSTKRKTAKKTFISLPDTGLLKRFTTDREHPQNVAPPTETSLRESIARSELSSSFSIPGQTPYWLADLMSGYTVENMSFAPVNTVDLERLIASSGSAIVDSSGSGSGGGAGGGGGGSVDGRQSQSSAAFDPSPSRNPGMQSQVQGQVRQADEMSHPSSTSIPPTQRTPVD